MRCRDELLGEFVFDLFPDDPNNPHADGSSRLVSCDGDEQIGVRLRTSEIVSLRQALAAVSQNVENNDMLGVAKQLHILAAFADAVADPLPTPNVPERHQQPAVGRRFFLLL